MMMSMINAGSIPQSIFSEIREMGFVSVCLEVSSSLGFEREFSNTEASASVI